jgi:hypothetical protein
MQIIPMLFNNSRYSNRLPIGTEEVLKMPLHKPSKDFIKKIGLNKI